LLQLPTVAPWCSRHVRNQYVLRIRPPAKRQAVWDGLKAADIGCEIYYPVPLHLQPCYAELGYKRGDLPVSEAAADETIAIPIYPELSYEQKQFVVETLTALLEGAPV